MLGQWDNWPSTPAYYKEDCQILTHVPIFTELVSPHCVALLMDGAKLCIENTVVEPMPLE